MCVYSPTCLCYLFVCLYVDTFKFLKSLCVNRKSRHRNRELDRVRLERWMGAVMLFGGLGLRGDALWGFGLTW